MSVKVFGDEYYQRVESPDGRTLIRGTDGWIHNAGINADSSDFVPLEIYRGASLSKSSLAAENLHADIKQSAIIAKSEIVRSAFNHQSSSGKFHNAASTAAVSQYNTPSGNIVGLTVLIQFPDHPEEVPQSVVDSFCNQVGYNQYETNGSVRDFFSRASLGALNYTNHVTAYYTANHNFAWYDTIGAPDRSDSLTLEALTWLKNNQGFDFSTLSSHKLNDTLSYGNNIYIDSTLVITALNFMYAGTPQSGWAQGLWPHSGYLPELFTANGLSTYKYQICNLTSVSKPGDPPGPDLGIFAHEDGHMLCGFPDLYPASSANGYGVGRYCTMCYGCRELDTPSTPLDAGAHNPPSYNPFFRYKCGWLNPTDITYSNDTSITLTCNDLSSVCLYRDALDKTQMYFIEARRCEGGFRSYKDSGLIIWRVNTNGDNYNTSTYLLSVEQADNRSDIESGTNCGDSTDFFRQINGKAFSDLTSPAATWVNASYSGLDIRNVSAVGSSITFDLGSPSVSSSARNSLVTKSISAMLYKSELIFSVPVAGRYSVSLFSLTGRCVSKNVLVLSAGTSSIKISDDLAAGQYVLKIIGAECDLTKSVHLF